MKKLFIILTAGTAFAFASCASTKAPCCGSCKGKSESACCGTCDGSKDKKSCCGTCKAKKN